MKVTDVGAMLSGSLWIQTLQKPSRPKSTSVTTTATMLAPKIPLLFKKKKCSVLHSLALLAVQLAAGIESDRAQIFTIA